MKSPVLGFVLCSVTLMLLTSNVALAQTRNFVEVGVSGDDASRGNMGIRAAIRTHLYDTYPSMFDYFWIGNVLDDGAFVQFGYSFQPGPAIYCLKGLNAVGENTCTGKSELISNLEGRWEWQYWPNINGRDFYYEIGSANSVGLNGSWHEYSIVSSEAGWHFLLDGLEVGNLTAKPSLSKEPPVMIAEKAGATQLIGALGAAEFHDLEYYKDNAWHEVQTLFAVRTCSSTPNCNLAQPYGVLVVGPDHVIAGSVHQMPNSGELVWTSGFLTLIVTTRSAQFSVSTFAGRKVYVNNASVEIPRGMMAYVSLIDKSIPASGILGVLGARDEFQGWTGSVSSRNQTVQILMNDDSTLQATWRVDYTGLLVIIAPMALALIAIAVYHVVKQRRTLMISRFYINVDLFSR